MGGSTVTAQYSVYMEGILQDALKAQAALYKERSKANLHEKNDITHDVKTCTSFVNRTIKQLQFTLLK